MKLKRFMCEYASYIESKFFKGYNSDIENMLKMYMRGLITVREVMNTLVQIEYACSEPTNDKE